MARSNSAARLRDWLRARVRRLAPPGAVHRPRRVLTTAQAVATVGVGASELQPSVVTAAIPGPRSLSKLATFADGWGGTGSAASLVVDIARSNGCFVADVDGNEILDCFGYIGSLPLGYNHPSLLSAARSDAAVLAQVHRSALGVLPPADHADLVESTLGTVAPRGLTKVQTMACGSCANENAFKVAMINHAERRRMHEGREPDAFTERERDSAMLNQAPGAPPTAILSFNGGFHGRTLGALSCTRSNPVHKLDVAQLDWPAAPFPQLQYPLAVHADTNAAEVDRCLEATKQVIDAHDGRIAAMIIEPVQAEGGDRHAPPEYFRRLRQLALDSDITFIVDEVQTGVCASGTFWAHESWGLTTPPDIVTFAKKMQIAGYFYTADLQMTLPYRIFNTWMGDPAKLHQLAAILRVIEDEDLLPNTRAAGETLLDGFHALVERYPWVLGNARGTGTLCAIDVVAGTDARGRLHSELLNRGVLVGVCGTQSLRMRPPLTFTPGHAEVVLDRLESVAREMA